MFYHKDCNLPVALRYEQGEGLIHVLVVVQIQVLLIFLVICYWIYLHVSESRSEHSCITHPFWQNSQFSTFEVVLRMAFWSEDFYGKKGSSFHNPPHYGELWWWWKVTDEWRKWSWAEAFCRTCCDVNIEDNDAGEKTSLHHNMLCALRFFRKPKNNKQGWNDCWHGRVWSASANDAQ